MKYLLLILVFLCSQMLPAQNYSYNEEALRSMLKQEKIDKEKRKNNVDKYLAQNPDNKKIFKFDEIDYYLFDVRNNIPIFYATHNNGSALSLGVDKVRANGDFGLDLSGENTRIAIWDSGISKNSHIEFQGRLLNNDSGADFSDHSTHVMGTILAGGLNPDARGFCYNANAQAFDWFDDTEEMINEVLSRQILVSNHSYGVPGGWVNGSWRGDQSISTSEDYRFGFYDNEARAFDQISYNAPFYTIVNSAGNERGDSGNGSFPPDGPFDCISGFATAKNVITVGAVNKIPSGYNNPEDVIMSDFSSWGPVDDGRIKPDFVAPGVNLLSPISGSDNSSYANFSGTSMASPSAAGGVALINEAYHLFNNSFLNSASMKGLIIHTINEAGSNDGPDYRFGWGLMSVENAVTHILELDNVNKYIIETTLDNNETYELELNPIPGKKITATLVWTDLPGDPTAPSLDPTDLMLVNDLDMIIVDEVGNEQLPWILDPNIPGLAAKKGNNFRDNVEKIEFDAPELRKYFVRISHKGQLESGSQNFSLIVTYESEDQGLENLYWVDGDGAFNDSNHWSSTSGGSTGTLSPNPNAKLIFDDNSFGGSGSAMVNLTEDLEVASIVALNDKEITFNLNGNTLTVSGNTLLASEKFKIINGNINLKNINVDSEKIIDFNESELDNISLNLDESNSGEWTISENDLHLDHLTVYGGDLILNNCNISANEFQIGNLDNGILRLENTVLNANNRLLIASSNNIEDNSGNQFVVNGDVEFGIENMQLNIPIIVNNGVLNVVSQGMTLNNVSLIDNSNLALQNDLNVTLLNVEPGSEITFINGSNLFLNDAQLNSTASSKIKIISQDGIKSGIEFVGRQKKCFDNLQISSVDLLGISSISVGQNSDLTNSSNWFVGNCSDLLFADFSSSYLCQNALSIFEDKSDGDVQSRLWKIDDEPVFGDKIMDYQFDATGNYMVSLEVTDMNGSTNSFEQEVSVSFSNIEANRIVEVNSNELASLKASPTYQWYNYGQKIEGETDRVFKYNGAPGIYWVLTFDGDCNRISEILDLGTNVVEIEDGNSSTIYPNPVVNDLDITFEKPLSKDIIVSISDMTGRTLINKIIAQNSKSFKLSFSNLVSGVYLLNLRLDNKNVLIKIVKN